MKTTAKITILSFLTLGLFSFTTGNNEGNTTTNEKKVEAEKVESKINFFEGSWEDALKMAKDEGKLIFLDAMASWCGPCKLMDAKTFTDAEVATYFNENFINVQMDMEKHADGKALLSKYEIVSYPTLLFVDKTGKIVKKSIGLKYPKDLLDIAKTAK